MGLLIKNTQVDHNSNVFIVAELSANHNHDIETAIKTVQAAKKAGADAIKLQTYTPDTMTLNSTAEFFKIKHGTLWDGKTLYDLYKEAYTPWEWHPILKEAAEKLGLVFFSTPFDHHSVDFLESLEVPVYKIASFEITDIPLIEYVAAKGKPVILSTGVATLDEIREAVETCRKMGNHQIAILKCTSAYPAPVEEINLRTIPDIIDRFGVVCGISDHTTGINISIASVPLGVKIIERHLILDRSIGGPDAAFSLEPAEFKTMVQGIREVERALGRVTYDISPVVEKNRVFCRSLFVCENIRRGDLFSEKNIRSIRPGHGLQPKYRNQVIGCKAACNISGGTPLSWAMVEK